MKALIYDIEIIKAIPPKNGVCEEGIAYRLGERIVSPESQLAQYLFSPSCSEPLPSQVLSLLPEPDNPCLPSGSRGSLELLQAEGLSLPLEPKTIDHDRIAALEAERDRLIASGAIAPSNVWIETSKIQGKEFKQSYWRSRSKIFGDGANKTYRQYIGRSDSVEAIAAGQAVVRRNRLAAISKELGFLYQRID